MAHRCPLHHTDYTRFRPGYPTPLVLNIDSAMQNFSLANVSIPVGQGFVVLMTDIYNSSNIVSRFFSLCCPY